MAARGGPFDPRATFLALADGPDAVALEITEDFWTRVGDIPELQSGRMVGVIPQESDWNHWEMHPDGDEVLYLVTGAMDVVLQMAEGEQKHTLTAGQGFVVPRGTWHRVEIREAGELFFITRGRGTEHKPVE